jgi:hypothetical protein
MKMNGYEALYRTMLLEHEKVFAAQDTEALETAMQEIASAARVFVTGAGREGIAARGFAMRLVHLGKEVHWLWDDTTPGMKSGDLFLAVNGSGCIGHIDYLLDRAKETGARRLIITGSPEERTPSEADACLFVPAMVYKGKDPRTVASAQPMGNLFEQHLFLLFDILAMLLTERLHETHETMEARHRNIE